MCVLKEELKKRADVRTGKKRTPDRPEQTMVGEQHSKQMPNGITSPLAIFE